MIDLLASESHYLSHLLPIWNALDPALRGAAYVRSDLNPGAISGSTEFDDSRPVLVASWKDHQAVRPRQTVFVEHGSGQSYDGDEKIAHNPSYSGGTERDGAILFIVPNEEVARRNRAAYPDVPNAVVGCPRLDKWHSIPKLVPLSPSTNFRPTVAISFHSDLHLCPETRWAFPHFQHGIEPLKERFTILGHGHPRMHNLLRKFYARWGIEFVADFDEVVERADVYAVDNSSTAFEWMSLDRPLVWLTPPWYRRNVSHGLRFWSAVAAGVECTDPARLGDSIDEALKDVDSVATMRREVVSEVYAFRDGQASERAARAIEEVLR